MGKAGTIQDAGRCGTPEIPLRRELPDRTVVILSTALGSAIQVPLRVQRQRALGIKSFVPVIDRGTPLPAVASRHPLFDVAKNVVIAAIAFIVALPADIHIPK